MQKHERFWSGEKMLKKFTTGMRRETEILYQMYGKAICAIAYKYLRDNELAEDCLQEVMLLSGGTAADLRNYKKPSDRHTARVYASDGEPAKRRAG